MFTDEEQRRAERVSLAMREAASVIAAAVVKTQRTCLTCCHFNEKEELCALAHKRPPARVIAFGCDSYDDEIPF